MATITKKTDLYRVIIEGAENTQQLIDVAEALVPPAKVAKLRNDDKVKLTIRRILFSVMKKHEELLENPLNAGKEDQVLVDKIFEIKDLVAC